jgi:hypothetical protein
MATILPGDIFAGYEYVEAGDPVTANSIVIPLSDLPELTALEADGATGNGAQLLRAIDKAIHDALEALPEVDRPTNVTADLFTEQTSTTTRSAQYSRRYLEVAPALVFDLAPEV